MSSRSSIVLAALLAAACAPSEGTTPDAADTVSDAGEADAGTPVAPVVTTFAPVKGPAGSTVAITGTGFSATASDNTVVFLGAEGATDDATATVTSATTTELQVTVPETAQSGPISVTTAGGTAAAEAVFTVGVPLTIGAFAGLGAPAMADTSFSIGLTGTGLTTVKTDYTVFGSPVFGGEATPFTVLAAGAGYLTLAAPLTTGTFFLNAAFKGETATSTDAVQIYDWAYLHDFYNGVTRGEPYVKGVVGQEVRVGFTPSNPDAGSYTIELLDASGNVVHTRATSGSSGSPQGTFAVSFSGYNGPLGTFRARLKFEPTSGAARYSTVSGGTMTFVDAAP